MLPNLRFSGTALPVSPASVTFVNGVWTGDVTLTSIHPATRLTITDLTTTATGESNPMAVVANPYQTWASAQNLVIGQDGPSQDPDHDGVPNILEWAFGSNPNLGASILTYSNGNITSHGHPLTTISGNGPMAVFGRRLGAAALGLSYIVEFSADLQLWEPSNATSTVLATDAEIQVVSVPYPAMVGGVPPKFFRIKINRL